MDFGEVLTVTVMNNKYIGSGQPMGYGYVEMASKSEGATAVAALNGKALKHMTINIIEALPLSDKKAKALILPKKLSDSVVE
jgi:RNA recognition motif-containing protein